MCSKATVTANSTAKIKSGLSKSKSHPLFTLNAISMV